MAAVPALSGCQNVMLVSLATDGGDGNTGAAGAVVTGDSMRRALDLGLDPAEFLANNDSHTFFRHLGDCLMPGPTRTNVNDLLFLFQLEVGSRTVGSRQKKQGHLRSFAAEYVFPDS